MSLSGDNNLRSNQDQYRAGAMLDTLAIVKMLRKVGFSEEQAEAQANVISYSVNNTAVTKSELLEAKQELKDEINNVRTELKDEINNVKTELHETEKRLDDKINQVKIELKDEIYALGNKFLYTLGGCFVAMISIIFALLEYKLK